MSPALVSRFSANGPPKKSCQSFIALVFRFRSLVHLELIFVYGVTLRVQVLSLACRYPAFPAPFIENTVLSYLLEWSRRPCWSEFWIQLCKALWVSTVCAPVFSEAVFLSLSQTWKGLSQARPGEPLTCLPGQMRKPQASPKVSPAPGGCHTSWPSLAPGLPGPVSRVSVLWELVPWPQWWCFFTLSLSGCISSRIPPCIPTFLSPLPVPACPLPIPRPKAQGPWLHFHSHAPDFGPLSSPGPPARPTRLWPRSFYLFKT